MQRVYGLVEDEIVHRIDGDASVMGVSRSKWLGLAIDTFLNRDGDEFAGDHRDHGGDHDGDGHDREIAHLKEIISIKDSEIQHLRYLTNDLRSLADNLAAKVPMLTGPTSQEEEKKKSWWKFWK